MRIDSHQHFWRFDQAAYPWIQPSMSVLRRDYLPEDLAPLLAASRIDGVVAVQAQQTVEETRWLLSLADEHAFVRGVVGWAPLVDPNVEAVIADLRQHSALKGIRHILHDEPDDRYMLRDDFQRGLASLDAYGLVYDILIFAKHLPYTLDLVDAFPYQPFVVDHVAKPAIAAAQFDREWAAQLRKLAERPQVTCKLSGVVTEVRDPEWNPTTLAPYVETALEAFGASRLLFGTDWPVCLLRSSYSDWTSAVGGFIGQLSESEQRAIMGENAARVYRLSLPPESETEI
jgi:L-fuconolactonase